ncbi:bifunctional transcriptional activator/DNA repair enzyme AdaA [Terracidiphilus sp.]|jgi:AraC family transcriptional regulator of adaptative response/methylated-DNA-[protein]-cysteine methyltransferase|uniref:bifunctional transcriptional activator/DNA repair enzyme AdaA n=1 Tax=Terracidiphilus sp. TaxID=1964191 RepID=UPI003C23DED8
MTATAQLAPQLQINPDSAWEKLISRDKTAGFLYAVLTTGVFCRIGCGSRPPRRENVRFFGTAAEASSAGFRPCQRCTPTERDPLDRVREHIERNLDRAVPLAELARISGLSPFTVQRNFKREFSVSPLAYQRALRAARFRAALKEGNSVTDAVYNAGFSSPSRAHEAAQLGMTPARFAQGGKGERIGFATASTPFGWMIVGATDRGLCWLALDGTKAAAETTLREEFPLADLRRDASLSTLIDAALASVHEGSDLSHSLRSAEAPNSQEANLTSIDLRGTVFQLRVWNALRQIPRGQTRTYSQLARELGMPNSTRAVARACALNRVSVLVPCHRVVGVSGSLTGYRWGVERKRKLLDAEKERRS